jgi:hypothetical protein
MLAMLRLENCEFVTTYLHVGSGLRRFLLATDYWLPATLSPPGLAPLAPPIPSSTGY